MSMVERLEQACQVRQSCQHHQHVEDLMAAPDQVILSRMPSLRPSHLDRQHEALQQICAKLTA